MYRLNGKSPEDKETQPPRFQIMFWGSVALVGFILLVMGQGIAGVVRGLEFRLAAVMIGSGVLIGAFLVRFSRSWISSVLFSLLGGVLYTAMVVGRLWDDLWLAVGNIWFWLGTVAEALNRTLRGTPSFPSMTTLILYIYDFTESLFVMLQRFVLWVWRFPRMNSDMISTQLIWGLVIWLVSIWAAWFFWKKNRPLEAVIPAFLIVAVARTYANASSNVVLIMLGGAVLLMVFSSQADREQKWIAHNVGYSGLIRKNSTQTAMMLSVALVFAAGGITSIDIDQLREWWEDFTTKQQRYTDNSSEVRQSLGIEADEKRTTLAESFSRLGRGGLPTNFLVGSSPDLADEVVMIVLVEETDPITGDVVEVDPAAQTYYFRSLNYDFYQSSGWISNDGKIYVYQGGQEAISSYTNHQRLIKQQVRYADTSQGIYKVHVVGEVAVVDREYNVAWREGSGLSAFTDMFGATLDSRSYEAYSVVPVFSEEELRNAPTNYPDWMLTRYLELPDSVPERVINLAYDLTQNELTSYDKAVAIEQYLRTFPYTLDLPTKPASIDIVDYFLFDIKEGYCDYYASSMVVLARAVGIPARLAIGYIGGTYDPENEVYVVTADQAHSWAEIYFPEYGWVTFEPTAGRPAVERENLAFDLPSFEREIEFTNPVVEYTGLEITLMVLGGGFLLAIVVGLIWLRAEVFWLRHIPIEKTFRVVYRRLIWFSKQLGVERGEAQTPLEFTQELQDRLMNMREKHRPLAYLAQSTQKVDALVRLTNKAAYSLDLPDVFERARAVYLWVALRRQLGFAIFWLAVTEKLPKRRKVREKLASA